MSLNLKEDPRIRIIYYNSRNPPISNVVGIALAGKLRSVERATAILRKACMGNTYLPGEGLQLLLKELGLTEEELYQLTQAHHKLSVTQIVEKLREGWTLDIVASYTLQKRDELEAP